ncbi:conserved Plasmodium protein, unknown function [Plasmodium gallinaceum]|uniref:Uncharacterized protein n=1 Tax=Plasmodium gallinaceum TaxID=5849 RepID=A0A1J1GMF6_PLAGA|nr:conserved Plasmodium protein, unknown function [Plasmodium gallinaceum]CRG93515.1 conserved Plasmodium protein, unknown function [Plasmodium gallinaceum]
MDSENIGYNDKQTKYTSNDYGHNEQNETLLMQEAEIVLITTSLGGIKASFFSSLRAQNLLNCKKYVYFVIDTNRDTSTAKNLKDTELFTKWKKDQLLLTNENGVILPQILIDGISIGNDVDLQNLEDEGNLDFIVARLKCPNCLIEKFNTDESCPNCKYDYVSLISDDLIKNNGVIRILQGDLYDEENLEE